MTPNGINLSEPLNVMVEQIVSVVRLLMERLQPDDPHFDVTELLFLVARYLNRLGKDDNALRVKLRFCQLVESILTREGMVATGQDGLLRNSLLEWFTEWSFEAQKVRHQPLPSQLTSQDHESFQTPQSGGQSRSQRDLDYACLCALVVVTEGLLLKSTTDTSDDTPMVVRARLFQRYLFQLTRVIERSALSDVSQPCKLICTANKIRTYLPDTEQCL